MKIYEGKFEGKGLKIGIVVSRFNELITNKLFEGAKDCLLRHGVSEEKIDLYYVPGAFEIPLIVKKISKTARYDGILTLGAVIKGDTPHFDYVSNEVSKGIAQVSLESEIPIGFGVLTTHTIEQAIERAGTKAGNKGFDSALTLIESINLINEI